MDLSSYFCNRIAASIYSQYSVFIHFEERRSCFQNPLREEGMRQECASKEWIIVKLRKINFEGAKILVLLSLTTIEII